MEYAFVVALSLTSGTGALAEEPVSVATLRESDGVEHVVKIVGGPSKHGGYARLVGHVVPVLGARVRLDLREEPSASRMAWLPSASSWAPREPAGTWDKSKLPLALDIAAPGSRDLGAALAGELEVAARTWTRPACSSFRAHYGATMPLTPGDDGHSGVFFHDAVWPEELVPGALAQTIVHLDAGGRMSDADIHVNGANYRFSLDGAAGTQDARSVLVHELGHVLGLGHSTDARATMYVSGSGLRWRSLEKDDIDGLCALYPGRGSAGCDVEPCPDGFSCVAGSCQRPGERSSVCSPCSVDDSASCEASGDTARCLDFDGGHACGKPCIVDDDCGVGFSCRPTSEAGDLQCVSFSRCAISASNASRASDAGAAREQPAPEATHSASGCAWAAPAGRTVDVACVLGLFALARAVRQRTRR